ncbi:MAG: anaerobic ribonucleoside-triphosphate reductase activating protein [Christensenellales bacterium]
MTIKGMQKLTLLDYPGKLACTLFTGGCNFLCPFCQNSELVLCPEEVDTTPNEEVFSFLEKRKHMLEGVCITGGEPTLQQGLAEFIGKIKAIGLLVKLDTNGYEPDRLAELIGSGLIDYIAMDIKSSPERYSEASGIEGIELSRIERSIDLIVSSGIEHEFRTTVVHELHTREDLAAIARRLTGEKRYFLQRFVDSGEILCEGMSAPTDDEMHDYLSAVREFIPTAELRGME